MSLYKFQAQRAFTWEGMLENNINHIMRSHLTFSTFGLRWFFDRYYIAPFRLYDKLYFIKNKL
jgi:hypothetical protein